MGEVHILGGNHDTSELQYQEFDRQERTLDE